MLLKFIKNQETGPNSGVKSAIESGLRPSIRRRILCRPAQRMTNVSSNNRADFFDLIRAEITQRVDGIRSGLETGLKSGVMTNQ